MNDLMRAVGSDEIQSIVEEGDAELLESWILGLWNDSEKLRFLEMGGVDNWEGYDEAMRELDKEYTE